MLGLFPRAPGAEGRSRGSRCRRVGVPVSVEDTPELRDPAAYGAGGGRLWGAGCEAPKRARGVPEPFGRESGRRCPPRGRGAPPGRSRPSDKPRPFLASDSPPPRPALRPRGSLTLPPALRFSVPFSSGLKY